MHIEQFGQEEEEEEEDSDNDTLVSESRALVERRDSPVYGGSTIGR